MNLDLVWKFFEIKSFRDIPRILKLPFLIGLEAAKIFFMVNCGCQVDELNNWVTTSLRNPYYWRTASSGTRFVAGPYSYIWYALNIPAIYGYWAWMFYLLIFDIFLSVLVFQVRGWKFLIPFMMSSTYFYDIDPVDFWPFFFIILGMFLISGPIIAVLIKVPFNIAFQPQYYYVWDFLLNNPYGIHEPGGWLRYGQLIVWFLWSITFYFHRRRKKG